MCSKKKSERLQHRSAALSLRVIQIIIIVCFLMQDKSYDQNI